MAKLLPIDAASFVPHPLHAPTRTWPETNCYVDLWIEVLHAFGLPPAAALGFTVTQDFEGDQFTFFKFPPEDLQGLFGLTVQELAIYDTVQAHTREQLQRGRLVLLEADSFYLPDTRGTAYRQDHVKTTVAVSELELDAKRLGYFHNAGYYELTGEDFEGVFANHVLFPYVEFVKRDGAQRIGKGLVDEALQRLRGHLERKPPNPLTKFRADFPRHVDQLASRPMAYFHLYAFNVLRQLGANFELLGSHCQWLTAQGEGGLEGAIGACEELAESAKGLLFALARAANKKKFGDYSSTLDTLEAAHDRALGVLTKRYG